ncbi:zinc finger, CCHC-type containing protein [Tanacetum coccineum]
MAGNTVKDMTRNFGKLDKFKGHDFRRWQKKMHFLLTMLKVVYVLTTPMPELLEDAIVEAIRIMAKWENDDYICRGHILNDSSSTSGWVFLLGGGVISWASKKQTCITGSTMESEFVALAAASKEAEWL